MSSATQSVKDYLVRLGPKNALVRMALRLEARRRGYGAEFGDGCIKLSKAHRKVVLSYGQYVQVPWMLEYFDFFFDTLDGESVDRARVLDFSKPGLHRYTRSGVALHFPSIPEDDVMSIYTKEYEPKADDVVWDVGAHAGATTYFLSRMVGEAGRVYAFEPDETNFEYLLMNIERHDLHNVTPVKKALAGETGTASFNMDGTMAAGLSDYLVYKEERCARTVSTMTLADACQELGSVPDYIKMDIEGAEVDVVRSAGPFLRDKAVHFAIESGHRVGGELTHVPLEKLFSEIGYTARTATESGQIFTWAAPASRK